MNGPRDVFDSPADFAAHDVIGHAQRLTDTPRLVECDTADPLVRLRRPATRSSTKSLEGISPTACGLEPRGKPRQGQGPPERGLCRSKSRMREMPKVSKESAAHVDDLGVAEDRHEELGGYTVDFTSIRQDMDLTPLLKGLPDDRCQCPHWGYMFKGRMKVRYADREEIYEAGDAFYMPPGHAPSAEAGSEFLQISPTEELQASVAVIMKNMQKMQAA
jgi:hypothetical protein